MRWLLLVTLLSCKSLIWGPTTECHDPTLGDISILGYINGDLADYGRWSMTWYSTGKVEYYENHPNGHQCVTKWRAW